MGQHLLREVAICLRGLPGRIVLEHGHPLHGSLCETHGLADARCEHSITEVLLEDLDRLLRVQRPRVDQRRQDPLDLDVGVQVLADHVQRVLELDEPAHGEVLALHGDDHLVRRRQRVDRQQPETRGRVDQDEVVVLADRRERLLQRAFAADHGRHRDLRACEVDAGAGDVHLAALDDVAHGGLVDEDVVHRQVQGVRIDALRHRQVALGVHVDAQHPVSRLGERGGQVEGRRRLGDAALLVRERDGLCLGLGGLRLHAVRIRRGFAESSTRTVPCGSDGRRATAAARRGDGRRYDCG